MCPDDKKDALRRQVAQAMLEVIEAPLHVFGNGSASIRNTEHARQRFHGREDVRDGVRIGGVGRDSQFFQRMNRFKAIIRFSDEDEIRVKRGDHFHTGVNATANFGFLLGVRRIVALVGVADETLLEAERINGFRQVGSERNNAANRLRDANGAAGFIDDFAKSGRFGGRVRRTLRVRGRRGT